MFKKKRLQDSDPHPEYWVAILEIRGHHERYTALRRLGPHPTPQGAVRRGHERDAYHDATEEMTAAGVDPHDDDRLKLWSSEVYEPGTKHFVTYLGR